MADGGQAELGKEIKAFSILLANPLMSQGFITISAGEQGEEITQTPGDMTELIYNAYKREETKSSLGKAK